jgi:hypothetical protein
MTTSCPFATVFVHAFLSRLPSWSWLTFNVGQKKMTPHDILEELVCIDPDFRAYWESENLYLGDDGSFTACGVFSQFTGFFRAHHLKMKKEELEAIAALVGRCERDDFLTDSAYTCFLENIAGDPPEGTLAPFLSTAAIESMSNWRPQK